MSSTVPKGSKRVRSSRNVVPSANLPTRSTTAPCRLHLSGLIRLVLRRLVKEEAEEEELVECFLFFVLRRAEELIMCSHLNCRSSVICSILILGGD